MIDEEGRRRRRSLVKQLLEKYAKPDTKPLDHKHIWYLAGTIRHPRMGWPVDFYLCTDISWSVDLKCFEVALGDGESGNSTAGQVFENFEKAYYWLGDNE